MYISNELKIKVLRPSSEAQKELSDNYFTTNVSRLLKFKGSKVLSAENEVLKDVLNKIPDSKASVHAAYALATPLLKPYKVLNFNKDVSKGTISSESQNAEFQEEKPNINKGLKYVTHAVKNLDDLLDSFGHIEACNQLDILIGVLISNNEFEKAEDILKKIIIRLEQRGVIEKVVQYFRQKLKDL